MNGWGVTSNRLQFQACTRHFAKVDTDLIARSFEEGLGWCKDGGTAKMMLC